MPSVKNPNRPSKNRLAARAATARKTQQQRSAAGKSRIDKAAARRGARPGLLPTSGPGAPVSAKKRRKLDQRIAHALKRKMEAEGEVEMKNVEGKQHNNISKTETATTGGEEMELDIS